MNTQILEEIGLSKTEIKIYLTLLKIGQSTTTNIVRDAKIHASKVYEFLDRLVHKGLVTYTIQANKKHFAAVNPSFLEEFLREKQRRIEEQKKEIHTLIPQMHALMSADKEKINFKVYEGLRGIKSFYDMLLTILAKGDTSHVIGAPRIGNERLEGFLLDWHARRIKKGIQCEYIYDSNVRDYGKIREKMKFTRVKYLPNNIVSPMWIEISGDFVAIAHIKGDNAILFAIQDKEIARGYLDYFKLLWEISKK
ncbi:MAG TPA: helix-turn-helix domain-containing protein [Candidatus Nanoarchaeia archaeon]|nr:helix-turn-helix domain-containing protein [Candidatus Nanoarchaeia archaeon]